MRVDTFSRREFLGAAVTAALASGSSRGADEPTISPELGLAKWKQNMLQFGEKHGKFLANGKPTDPIDPLLGATYYDAQRVFYQIADFTGDKKWVDYAIAAMKIYRDRYVLPNHGMVPGYWNFSQGIAMHHHRTKDEKSREAVKLLATRAAFAPDTTPEHQLKKAGLSRENAYVILARLNAEVVGEPRTARLPKLVDNALGHIDQWFVSHTADYVQPFMVGLTAEALIRWHAKEGDERVLPALKQAAVSLWKEYWVPKSNAFKYMNKEVPGEGNTNPAPDLNQLIAPIYAWIYHMTGDVAYRNRAIVIFKGGVDAAFLSGGKQFNQSYRLSFDTVRWIHSKPLKRSSR
jgi:hypothetical protein